MRLFFSIFAGLSCLVSAGTPASAQGLRNAHVQKSDISKQANSVLNRLVEGALNDEPVAGAALVVLVDGAVVYQGAAGCAQFRNPEKGACARRLRADTKVRVASISKMAMAIGVNKLVDQGRIDLDADISTYLDWPLRNPDYPDIAITVRQLITHQSSVRDPQEYWVLAPEPFKTIFESQTPPFAAKDEASDRRPGHYFTYANLNSAILATIIEKVSGQRFDHFMQQMVFAPLELHVGYNWFGISPVKRRQGASLYRWIDNRWTIQKDDRATLKMRAPDILALDGTNKSDYLASYIPGENASIFSPQGGLRASALDLAVIVQKVATMPAMKTAQWTINETRSNGDTEDGFFSAYGLGTQIITGTDNFHPGQVFTGHSGEAYGLYSGAWSVSDAATAAKASPSIEIAFVVTGTQAIPAAGRHSSFNAVEETLMDAGLAAAHAYQASKTAHNDAHHGADDEPRPYDPDRDAMADVDDVLARAKESGRKPLIVLGANWCHDSRGLAARFEKPRFQSLLADHYELVYVDVGQRDRNLDVAKRFGIHALVGTPNVLILDAEHRVMNSQTVSKWRRAASISDDETHAYFSTFANGETWVEPK